MTIIVPCAAPIVANQVTFPLAVSTNGKYLQDAQGNAFLLNGDTPWSLAAQLTNAEIDTYLADTTAKGFTAILFNAPERNFTSQSPLYNNVDGESPFDTMTDWASGLNNLYWNHVDYIVGQAKALGIVCMINPAYLGFEGGSQGWNTEVQAESDADLQTYGAALANRYTQGNVIWSMGGDYNGTTGERDKQWNIVTGIRSVRTTDIITGHGAPGNISGTGEAYADWNSYTGFNLNNTYNQDYSALIAINATALGRAMPFVMIESRYEGEPGTPVAVSIVRQQVYSSLLTGACGHFYGNNPIWHFECTSPPYTISGTWESHLSDTGRADMLHVYNLFNAYSWELLAPKQDASLVTSALGADSARICPALASDGSFALIWKPSSGSITIDMTNFTPSSVRAQFYNTTDGSYANVSGTPFANTGTQNISFPGERVLVMDAHLGSGNTIYADTASRTDVLAAIALASDGDTVVVPAGTASWSGGITVDGITLQGPGKDAGSPCTITAGKVTVTKHATYNSTLRGFRFTGSDAQLTVDGNVSDEPFIIYDMYYTPSDGSHGISIETNGGLISTCDFICPLSVFTVGGNTIASILGGTAANSEWGSAHTMGSADTSGDANTYVEDCVITYLRDGWDCDNGSKMVFRYNTLNDASIITHGGGSGDGGNDSSQYGCRHLEIYNNTFNRVNGDDGPINRWIWFRGSSGIVANNAMDDANSSEYPGKDQLTLTVGNCAAGYPRPYQCGQSTQTADSTPDNPILVFGNTGYGLGLSDIGIGANPNTTCSNPTSMIVEDRDFYMSNDWSWSGYTYPHPLTPS